LFKAISNNSHLFLLGLHVILGIMMNTPDTLDFYVVYFPRSGGRYFTVNYMDMTETNGTHLHDMSYLDKNNVLSLIRNPVDSIASTIVSGMFRNTIKDPAKSVDDLLSRYLETYQAILDSSSVLVSFDSLVNRFELVAQKVSSLFGHTIIKDFKDIRPKTNIDYLSTSRLDSAYEDMVRMVSANPLIGLCNDLYEKALSRSIC